MSEVDRLSNSGLYPALPIADKRPSREGSQAPPRHEKQKADQALPQAGNAADPSGPRPPKSFIDEYA
ncbi:MAG TPA: hypothetical protein VNW26_06970 [Steroidobacteraceae bacterium]|jgi:hypothetical protein|nr:hypothetical protein [Steroidobacteraceae bacterium]